MSLYEWYFRLEGDEIDINDLVEIFGDDVRIIKDENGYHQLIMELPFARNDAQEAREIAEGRLAKLNAIAQIVYGNHENVEIVHTGYKDPSGGPMNLFITIGVSIKDRSRVSGTLTDAAGDKAKSMAPKPIGDQFLAAADRNRHLERALYLFGCSPLDWRGLYMVLDAAREGNGGLKGLKAKKWIPAAQIEDFKKTANSYQALGAAARHGLSSGIDKATLTLQEAHDMVRTILAKWTKALM